MIDAEKRKVIGRSKGGKVTAQFRRNYSITNYYDNPNHCLNCLVVIRIPDVLYRGAIKDVKKRKFCSRSCATIYNNKNRKNNKCIICGNGISAKSAVCRTCYDESRLLSVETKGNLKKRLSATSYSSTLVSHANSVFNKSAKGNKCIVCGYDKHVDVCHIRSIASFPENARVGEINSITNLVGLCPNHHWEYDKGGLDISRFI